MVGHVIENLGRREAITLKLSNEVFIGHWRLSFHER